MSCEQCQATWFSLTVWKARAAAAEAELEVLRANIASTAEVVDAAAGAAKHRLATSSKAPGARPNKAPPMMRGSAAQCAPPAEPPVSAAQCAPHAEPPVASDDHAEVTASTEPSSSQQGGGPAKLEPQPPKHPPPAPEAPWRLVAATASTEPSSSHQGGGPTKRERGPDGDVLRDDNGKIVRGDRGGRKKALAVARSLLRQGDTEGAADRLDRSLRRGTDGDDEPDDHASASSHGWPSSRDRGWQDHEWKQGWSSWHEKW